MVVFFNQPPNRMRWQILYLSNITLLSPDLPIDIFCEQPYSDNNDDLVLLSMSVYLSVVVTHFEIHKYKYGQKNMHEKMFKPSKCQSKR
jgi:hypothetical protein